MAKRKTKKDIREELVEDIKQVIVQREGAEEVGTKEVLPTERPAKITLTGDATIVNLPFEDGKGEESQLTKDIRLAIAMVKPKNVVAIPLIFNKFKSFTRVAYNKREVLAEIRRLISNK